MYLAEIQETNMYGFAGVAGLVGLFSNQAAHKLKEVAESLLSTRESTRGADKVTEGKTSDFGTVTETLPAKSTTEETFAMPVAGNLPKPAINEGKQDPSSH